MAKLDDIFSLVIIKGAPAADTAPRPALASRLQILPNNVQQRILYLLLTTPQTNTVAITRGYQPPSYTQLSSTTRAQAADAYYANTAFHLPSHLCLPFLSSLTPHHRSLIKQICLDGPPKTRPLATDALEQRAIMAGHKLRWRNVCELRARLRDAGIEGIGEGAIKMWACFRGQTKATRTVVWTNDFDVTREEMGMPENGLKAGEVRWMSVKGDVWTREAKGSIGRVFDEA